MKKTMPRIQHPVIPIHKMADVQSPSGIEFRWLDMSDDDIAAMMQARKNALHRDDYYLFLFLHAGYVELTVDFAAIRMQKESVFYLRPGQTHFASSGKDAKGWSLAIEAALMEKEYQNIFEMNLSTQSPIPLHAATVSKISHAAGLLKLLIQDNHSAFHSNLISGAANTLIGIIAEQYRGQQDQSSHQQSRSAWIAYQFKQCLTEHFQSVKSPSQYAKMLNYSLAHMNASVKNATGFSVSHWISQQVILEARRLLCYTDLDIKEIAFRLGYEDHCYFSRLFVKQTGISPHAFRIKYRE